jgi:hypothetical protein
MARPQTFARDLKIATAGLEPDAIKGLLVSTALQALSDAQNAREFPSQYITTVNDRVGASIQSVEPPGPIVYTAVWWPEILEYGLAFAAGRSPGALGPVQAQLVCDGKWHPGHRFCRYSPKCGMHHHKRSTLFSQNRGRSHAHECATRSSRGSGIGAAQKIWKSNYCAAAIHSA